MKSGFWVTLAVSGAGALLCCREDPEHPPLAPPCPPGDSCIDPRPNPVPGRGGSDAGIGEGGAGGHDSEAGAGGAAEPRELTGTVRELVDDRFRASSAFSSRATIELEGRNGGLIRATYNGSSPFRLSGFHEEDPLWVRVTPDANRGVLPTLHPILLEDVGTEAIQFGLVRAETIDLIFAVSQDPEGPLEGHAQVVLWFRSGSGQGRPGVTVSLPEADFASYARGGTWSSVEAETDTTGLVLLANVSAPRFPGSTERIALGGTASGYIQVRVAADSVSLVEIPVQ